MYNVLLGRLSHCCMIIVELPLQSVHTIIVRNHYSVIIRNYPKIQMYTCTYKKVWHTCITLIIRLHVCTCNLNNMYRYTCTVQYSTVLYICVLFQYLLQLSRYNNYAHNLSLSEHQPISTDYYGNDAPPTYGNFDSIEHNNRLHQVCDQEIK